MPSEIELVNLVAVDSCRLYNLPCGSTFLDPISCSYFFGHICLKCYDCLVTPLGNSENVGPCVFTKKYQKVRRMFS